MKEERLKDSIKRILRSEEREIQEGFDDIELLRLKNEALKLFRKEKEKEAPGLHKFIYAGLKIAASLVLIIGISTLIYFMIGDQKSLLAELAVDPVENQNNTETRLILSDGSQIEIDSDESFLEYDKLGKTVEIDSDNTLMLSSEDKKKEAPACHKLLVPYGKQSKIILSDGTIVWLNSGSYLLYPQVFSGKKREVFLKGEAYFDVARIESQPFIVQTSDIKVEVLGTAFNVMAYNEDTNIEAVVIEGSVKVSDSGTHLLGKKSTILLPGQMASYSKNSKDINTSYVNMEQFVSWKDGYFFCKEISLEKLTQKLSRYYNTRVTIENQVLKNMTFSGKLENRKSLEETLKIICVSTRLNYQKDNENGFIIQNEEL